MSRYDDENNPHFRLRQPEQLNNNPQHNQPWDYHPTQIPHPDRINPRTRPTHIAPPPLMSQPRQDYPEPPLPPPPMAHHHPPENVHQQPVNPPPQHSRPVIVPPGKLPNRHSRPVYGPKPKPKPDSRPPRENLMYLETNRTNLITWCGAVFCIILWLVIILGGILVLTIYLVYHPRTPHFEISTATLNAVYLDTGYLVNADLTILVNFTNPNKKVNVDFSYVILQLYFEKHLIANQYIEPFSAFNGENKLANVEMVSSQVRLPMLVTQKMDAQIQRNRIMFEVDGIFHARSKFGTLVRYSYWLYGHCNLEMTGPPGGIIVSSKCYTKD